jgi:AAA domain
MLFRRIAVQNFRKLVSRVVIEGLSEGLTIIAGDNEEGKSTLLAAIRTGLFERHTLSGKSTEAMQPFGSSVRPEIQLDFEIDGKPYSITKGFAQRPSARLITPNGIFEGLAAEERLAELLRFKVPERHESRPDDQGILGLFWLEQARALDGLGFGETGRSTLRASMMEEVGDVLGGTRGRRLLEAAKTKRDELLTPIRGGASGRLRDANNAVEEAEKRLAEYETQRQEYDLKIDKLKWVRGELARIETDRILEKAQEDVANVEKQAKVIEGRRQQDQTAGQAVALAQAQLTNVNDRWTRRQAVREAFARKEVALDDARVALAKLETDTENVASQFEAARATMVTAAETRSDAEARVAVSLTLAQIEGLDKEIAGLHWRLANVDQLVVQKTAAQERLTGIKINKQAFESIQSLESTIGEVQAALGVIATRVSFMPYGGQVIRINGNEVPAREIVEVTEATRFTLEGFGAIDVEPGASELAELRARLRDAEGELAKALAVAGVGDAAQAKARLTERTEAEASINQAERLIAAYAPDGIYALRAALEHTSAERKQLDEQFDLSLAADIADPETEKRALASARAAEEAAKATLNAAQKQQQEHATQLAVAKRIVATEEEAVHTAKGELDTFRAEIADGDLVVKLNTAREDLAGAERRKTETERQLAAANPQEIQLRQESVKHTLRTVEGEQRHLRDDAFRVEGELIGLGQHGIGELLEEARGRRAQAIRHLNRLRAEANAWDLLVRTLGSAERDAKEAFLEPVLKRVDPFLRLLLPDARITLDKETLEITSVARDGREEPYRTLGVGTREQLSVLVRLAFAVYLREKGYPAAVILDDALVYADDGRFERMQLALRKAAETVQILILTCRARDWRDFGAPIQHLADGKTKAFSIPPAKNE